MFIPLGLPHNSSDWRLYIKFSKLVLEIVFLHNTNKYQIIPLSHRVHLMGSYDNMQFILGSGNYKYCSWSLYEEFKVICLLMSMLAASSVSGTVGLYYKQKELVGLRALR